MKPVQGSTAIIVTMQDNSFQPALWNVIAGQTIQLEIRNQDETAHDWTLLARPVTPPFDETAPLEIIYQHFIEAQTAETVTFQAPAAPGEYQVICQRHRDQGEIMFGWLIAVAPGDTKDW